MTAVVCLLTSVAMAYGQQPSSRNSIVLDIHIIDVSADRMEGLESAVKDRASLDRLVAEGRARPVVSAQIRARSGEQATARVGQRVPIQTASVPVATGVSAPQFQYENTGLSVDAHSEVIEGDQIAVRIKLELTALDTSTGSLTPAFIQRTVTDNVQLRSGETIILLGVVQHESLWPGSTQSGGAGASSPRGNFVVLLTARLVN
ncbi:MAG: type II and III secretion system protein [Blastocatellia bacterium]|nr:type II and III secretion system protein [Blastocatellia bacterium]